MIANTPVIGELYLLNSESVLQKCYVPEGTRTPALGQVFLCTQHFENAQAFVYQRVLMREDRFYALRGVEVALDAPLLLGQPLGHKAPTYDRESHRAGAPHNVSALYAALTETLIAANPTAVLKGLEPGEILVFEQDDNGSPFSKGGAFVYDNRKGKLTLGRREDGKLVKHRVDSAALTHVKLASLVGGSTVVHEPRLLTAGAFAGIVPFFEPSRWVEGPLRTLSPFAFVERVTGGRNYGRRKFHLVMQDLRGEVVRAVSEDVEVTAWLC
jgi:hypothetical protein